MRPGVTRHPALRSPDFPLPARFAPGRAATVWLASDPILRAVDPRCRTVPALWLPRGLSRGRANASARRVTRRRVPLRCGDAPAHRLAGAQRHDRVVAERVLGGDGPRRRTSVTVSVVARQAVEVGAEDGSRSLRADRARRRPRTPRRTARARAAPNSSRRTRTRSPSCAARAARCRCRGRTSGCPTSRPRPAPAGASRA